MKVAVNGLGMGGMAAPEIIAAIATNAERLGFSTIWASEHVVIPEHYESEYPYAGHLRTSGQRARLGDVPFLSPYVGLSYAAAHTERIRLGTGVALVPQYHPLLNAKLVSSLDLVCGGRFVFGVGAGWLKEEFDVLGVPWERRGARTDEYLAAMRAVWASPSASFDGDFVGFDAVSCTPRPVRGGVPIFIGGNSKNALRRAAAHADGWFGSNLSPGAAAETIDQLKAFLAENGRDPAAFEFSVSGPPTSTPDEIGQYRDAGVDELTLSQLQALMGGQGEVGPDEVAEFLEQLAGEWVGPAAALE